MNKVISVWYEVGRNVLDTFVGLFGCRSEGWM